MVGKTKFLLCVCVHMCLHRGFLRCLPTWTEVWDAGGLHVLVALPCASWGSVFRTFFFLSSRQAGPFGDGRRISKKLIWERGIICPSMRPLLCTLHVYLLPPLRFSVSTEI